MLQTAPPVRINLLAPTLGSAAMRAAVRYGATAAANTKRSRQKPGARAKSLLISTLPDFIEITPHTNILPQGLQTAGLIDNDLGFLIEPSALQRYPSV